MTRLRDRVLHFHAPVSEPAAERLRAGAGEKPQYTVEIHPPQAGDVPATLDRFVRTIVERQTRWVGLRNASPVLAFEVRRATPERLQIQLSVPTKRLERKVRTQLTETVPGVGFDAGDDGLPVTAGASVGGAVLTTGQAAYYPLRTDYDQPPLNALVAALHRDAMRDTKFVVQLLVQPIAGQPVRRHLWTRRAFRRLASLRKEKPGAVPWHDRSATPQERTLADQIEQKARGPRFRVAIRLLVIGAGDHTRSRVTEVASAFNVFTNPESVQSLVAHPVRSLFQSRLVAFAAAVRRRDIESWALPFRASPAEVGALLSLPARQQRNLQHASPRP